MKKILFLFLCLSVLKSYSRKEPLAPYYEKLPSRTLIVPLVTEDQKLVNKLTEKGKADELADYRSDIKQTNENLRTAFTAFWKLNKTILFVREDSVAMLVSKNPAGYAIAKFTDMAIANSGSVDGQFVGSAGSSIPGYFARGGYGLYLGERAFPIGRCLLPVDGVGQSFEKEDNSVAAKRSRSLHYVSVSKLYFIISRLYWLSEDVKQNPEIREENCIISGQNDMRNAKLLKNVTLILRAQDCEKKFNLDDAKKDYPYPVKIVTDDEFEKAILSKDESVAPVFICPASAVTMGGGGVSMTKIYYFQQAIDDKDGKLLCGFMANSGMTDKVLDYYRKSADNPKR